LFYSKYIYSHNWNIGFSATTPESLIKKGQLERIKWLKHSYKDRFFADPFVVNSDDSIINVLVEELPFSEKKGRIARLIIDNKSKRLIERHTILELESHLSYPAFHKLNGKIYLFPENSASGKLSVYEYNENSNSVIKTGIMISEPMTDATLFNYNNEYWLFASKVPESNEKLFLYHSENFQGEYTCTNNGGPIVTGLSSSRPAGNIFTIDGNIYRPAQNSSERYGAGMMIQQIVKLSKDEFTEKNILSITPHSFKYNLGTHTINFYEGGCVVDGYGYLYPMAGHIANFLIKKRDELLHSKH